LFCQPTHEIDREAIGVAANLLVEALGRNSIQRRQIRVEQDALTANDAYPADNSTVTSRLRVDDIAQASRWPRADSIRESIGFTRKWRARPVQARSNEIAVAEREPLALACVADR
jgi:hypothetical protein